MNIKVFFLNLKIGARINFYMALILFFVLIFLIFFYGYQKTVIIENTKETIQKELTDFYYLLDITEKTTKGGFTIDDYNLLKPVFQNEKFYDTGIPYLINKKGVYLIHSIRENKETLNFDAHQEMLSILNQTGSFSFLVQEDKVRKKWQYFSYFEPYEAYIGVTIYEQELFKDLNQYKNLIIMAFILAAFVFFFGVQLILKPIIKAINEIVFNISEMANGKLVHNIDYNQNDEIGLITRSMNILISGLTKTAKFSDEIGKGNLEAKFDPLSENDVLGNSLLEMRSSLIHAKKDEEARKTQVEKQNWATHGLAKFADILRQNNHDINKLSFSIMSNLVNYLEANQGAIFIINDSEPNDIFYEMTSAIAYDRQKLLKKKVKVGEELIGRAIHEKLTIYLKEIPEDYISITSGMGTANPKNLLLVPLMLNEEVFGVIELASFNEFEKHQVEFIEKLGENIASTISSVKINERTAKLLAESRQQGEEMAAQEEEMRQNMEELQATQEEMLRKENEFRTMIEEMQNKEERLKEILGELENEEGEIKKHLEKLKNL